MAERESTSEAQALDSGLLQVFYKVAQTLNFSRAATQLGLDQPVVTRKIKRLEERLGVELFRRNNRGCELTAAGEVMASKAGGILVQLAQLRDEVRGSVGDVRGQIAIGVTAAAGALLAPHLVSSIAAQWPLLRVSFAEDISRKLYERVISRDLALALLYDPASHPELISTPLLMERLHVIGAPGGPLAGRKFASVRDLVGLPLVLPEPKQTVRILLEEAFAELEAPLRPVYESNSLVLLRAMASRGLGYTVLSLATVADDVAAGRLAAVPLMQPGMSLALTLVTTSEHSGRREVQLMAELIGFEVRRLVKATLWPGEPQIITN